MRKARQLREEKRMSLRDVEATIGIDFTAVSKFEQGKALLREDALRRYADLLGVTIDELIRDAEEAVVGG